MTNHNTTDGEQHYFANDGSDWRSTASAVSTTEAREQDAAQDAGSGEADSPAANNETYLGHSVVEGSESRNPLEDEEEETEEVPAEEDETE